MTSQRFEIRVKGPDDQAWVAQFEELAITLLENNEFLFRGVVADQPALHGLLNRIRTANLVLISFRFLPVLQKPQMQGIERRDGEPQEEIPNER